ncbi:hypothetical protein ACFXHA_41615 [Nocardia sp. NPDC059240]|uniref:hypothetical protein n=1 Tax=Nocardia sp. NPDC059240 TaxID=3346786 RepID=UPI0036C4AF1E
MVRLIFLIPLVCWLLAARPSRARLYIGLALTAILVVQLVVSFQSWALRSCFESVEVLLSFVAGAVLVAGLIREVRSTDTPLARISVGAVPATLYCAALVLGTLWLTLVSSGTLDGPGGNGGKFPPIPPADELGSLPAGLTVLSTSATCSRTNWGPYCEREFAIGSTDGASDAQVADRVVRYLQDVRDLPLPPRGGDGDLKQWETCRLTGWWLDVEDETVAVGLQTSMPEQPATVVTIDVNHQGC